MNTKKLNNIEFQKAIHVAFNNDVNIYNLYCPHIKVESVNDIVKDISQRIWKGEEHATIKGVYEKGELIGYYVYRDHLLISFGLSVKYRMRKYLRDFYSNMKKELGGHFTVFLWSRNIRAIKWFIKNGCGIVEQNNLITQLITD